MCCVGVREVICGGRYGRRRPDRSEPLRGVRLPARLQEETSDLLQVIIRMICVDNYYDMMMRALI